MGVEQLRLRLRPTLERSWEEARLSPPADREGKVAAAAAAPAARAEARRTAKCMCLFMLKKTALLVNYTWD